MMLGFDFTASCVVKKSISYSLRMSDPEIFFVCKKTMRKKGMKMGEFVWKAALCLVLFAAASLFLFFFLLLFAHGELPTTQLEFSLIKFLFR